MSLTLDWKHWLLSHLVWVVGVAIAVVAFYSWRAEHDQRLIAEQAVKAAEVQVKTLQQSIADRDKAAAVQVAPIVKIIHDTVTVPQAIANLPAVVNQPLPVPVVPQPNNAVLIPEPDVLPLFNQVADDKVCRIQLDTTTKDLTDTKAIVVQKDDEIKALKKPKGFWRRVGGTMKAVGIGIGIGVALGHRI
jgi:hypothetical protein